MRKFLLKNLFIILVAITSITNISFATIDMDDLSDDEVLCGSGSSLDDLFAGGGTIYMRANFNFPEVADTSSRDLLSFDSSASVQNWLLWLQQGNSVNPSQDRVHFDHVWSTSTSGRARWRWSRAGTSGGGIPDDPADACVILTYNSDSTSNDPTIFLDGNTGTVAPSEITAPSGSPTEDNTAELGIGSRVAVNTTYSQNIYEVAGWTVVLSQNEIDKLCDVSAGGVRLMPNQIQPSSLKFYYTLDDVPDGTSADGDVFIDKSGNGNNCTGSDGADNVGMGAEAEPYLSYPE